MTIRMLRVSYLLVITCIAVNGCGDQADTNGNGVNTQSSQCLFDQTDCAGLCVVLSQDPFHCGECGFVCPNGQNCVNGSCVDDVGVVGDVAGNSGSLITDAAPSTRDASITPTPPMDGGQTDGSSPTGGSTKDSGAMTDSAISTTADASPSDSAATNSTTCIMDTLIDNDGDANIDLATEHQYIRGFGGINVPGWIADLTPDQVDTAFGNGPGQIGMTILRLRIPYDSRQFNAEVPAAKRAASLGAIVFATPWTPPPNLKTNNNHIGGRLNTNSYEAYADHLLSFRDFMESNEVPIYAISVQNEPDIDVDYESCYWNSSEFINWLNSQGSRFGNTKLIVAESFNFNRVMTDAILNNATAEANVDIIGGHIYGNGLFDYPLARQKGKEVWMTEHYTDSKNPANAWPLALDVGKEIHNCMAANFNAYIWWYIRRSYGPITEDGKVSKRGYLMAQYAKFVRPGFVRVDVNSPSNRNVLVTAYKQDNKVVAVVVNMNSSSQTITLDIKNGCVESFSKHTTSSTKNVSDDGTVTLTDNEASVTLDGQSVTTFVSL